MKVEEILALTKAGFTKEEIIQLAAMQLPEGVMDPVEEPSPEPPKEEPKEEPKDDPRLDDVINKLEKLSSGMEQLAIRESRMPERETAEQALAKIINPYLGNEKQEE